MSNPICQNPAFSRVGVCFLIVALWLIGSFFIAAPLAQMQTKNAGNKKTTATPTPKRAETKPTPKPAAKTVAKASPKPTEKPIAKATPKASPKTTPKTSPKPSPKPSPKLIEQRFITTAFNVNLRETASTSANEAGVIKLGTVVRSLERSGEKQTIGGKTDYWHRIAPVGGNKEGWIFGGFLRSFDQNNRESIYQQIAAERTKNAGKDFTGNVQLYEFLTRILPEIKTPETAAELGFARLSALKAALEAIPFEKKENPQYKNFTTAQNENIVYSEPSGQWYVRSELFWDLAKKYRALPIGEKIAWAATQNPLPGECEGYLNCYLYLMKMTHGTYLEQFPRGAHAKEAIKTIGDMLAPIVSDARKKEIYTPPSDVSDRAEFYQAIADLRIIISKTGFFEKDAVLRQLNQIAEGYR
ncbi:MAG TPA: SH3 domain-containing protein [Pyrinomonadaceae bacterium]|nr:SH3 domain-containing protein [Pyrinomonadaceae bacterium]